MMKYNLRQIKKEYFFDLKKSINVFPPETLSLLIGEFLEYLVSHTKKEYVKFIGKLDLIKLNEKSSLKKEANKLIRSSKKETGVNECITWSIIYALLAFRNKSNYALSVCFMLQALLEVEPKEKVDETLKECFKRYFDKN